MSIQKLYDFMSSKSLTCNKDLILDGKIHRFGANGDRIPDEWYVGYEFGNGHYYCTFGSWSGAASRFTYKSYNENESHSLELDEKIKQQMATAHAEILKLQEEARNKSNSIWQQSKEVLNHPYLTKKNVKPYGIKEYKNALIIPLFDINDNITSVQFINSEGKKQFLTNGKTACSFFVLGNLENSKHVYVCEGYATGASIHEATGSAVVITFSANNVVRSTFLLQDKYPNKIFVCAQDLGAAGEKVAKDWEETIKTHILKPEVKKEDKEKIKDFNDIHFYYGIETLKKQLRIPFYPSLTLEEFLAIPKPPKEWVVENLFVKGSLNMLYSEPGLGKSFFAYELAFCLGAQYNFMQWAIKNSLKCCVIDGEMTDTEVEERWALLIDRYDRSPEPKNLNIVTFNTLEQLGYPQIDLFKPECLYLLENIFEENDFIILDNYSNLTGVGEGVGYEDKAESWKAISPWFKKWRNKGKTILIIHHSNRAGLPRGSSAMAIDCSTIIKLKAYTGNNPNFDLAFDIHFEKGRHLMGKDKRTCQCKLHQIANGRYRWERQFKI